MTVVAPSASTSLARPTAAMRPSTATMASASRIGRSNRPDKTSPILRITSLVGWLGAACASCAMLPPPDLPARGSLRSPFEARLPSPRRPDRLCPPRHIAAWTEFISIQTMPRRQVGRRKERLLPPARSCSISHFYCFFHRPMLDRLSWFPVKLRSQPKMTPSCSWIVRSGSEYEDLFTLRRLPARRRWARTPTSWLRQFTAAGCPPTNFDFEQTAQTAIRGATNRRESVRWQAIRP